MRKASQHEPAGTIEVAGRAIRHVLRNRRPLALAVAGGITPGAGGLIALNILEQPVRNRYPGGGNLLEVGGDDFVAAYVAHLWPLLTVLFVGVLLLGLLGGTFKATREIRNAVGSRASRWEWTEAIPEQEQAWKTYTPPAITERPGRMSTATAAAGAVRWQTWAKRIGLAWAVATVISFALAWLTGPTVTPQSAGLLPLTAAAAVAVFRLCLVTLIVASFIACSAAPVALAVALYSHTKDQAERRSRWLRTAGALNACTVLGLAGATGGLVALTAVAVRMGVW